MLAWAIRYEWLLFFGLILALAVVDLLATRRAQHRARARRPEPSEEEVNRD